MQPKTLFPALLLASALAAGFYLATRPDSGTLSNGGPNDGRLSATVLPTRLSIPDVSLLDHNGRAVTADTFRGQWDLVFFGFTNCPDICPTTLQVLTTAKRQLAESGVSPLPRIVLVSVDPARDTPDKLADYVSYFGDGNFGVTGDLINIRKLTTAFGIFFAKQESDAETYSVDHSTAVLLFNEQGELHAVFGGPHLIAEYVHDLPLIMSAQ